MLEREGELVSLSLTLLGVEFLGLGKSSLDNGLGLGIRSLESPRCLDAQIKALYRRTILASYNLRISKSKVRFRLQFLGL